MCLSSKVQRYAAMLACSFLCLSMVAACDGKKHYRAAFTRDKITMDGKLTEAVWARAKPTGAFVNMFDYGAPQKTTARIVYDSQNIYVAFECDDTYIWATKTEKDDSIWEEEVVEVYVDPDGDRKNYFEYEVNPLATRLDLLIPKPGDQKDWRKCAAWNGGFRAAVDVQGTLDSPVDKPGKWTVEIAIPFSDFVGHGATTPPKRGDRWRIQLFRIDRPRDSERPVCTSWSPSKGVFHEPSNFGAVTWE